MAAMSLRICITTITLLHADFAVGLHSQVNPIKSEREYSESDSRQHFSKKSLAIFITDLSSESAEENYQEQKTLLLRSPVLSGDVFKVMADNDELGEIRSNIKRNGNINAAHVDQLTSLKIKPRHTSAETLEKREREHERRVKEIIDHVSVNYQSCIYLASEAKRIQNSRIVMDDLRKMAEDIDDPKHEGLKAKVLKCGRPIRDRPPFVWPKPNKLLIHVVKDSVNDGVY